jgi:DNA-binding IclR family transcriptional regulator
VDRPDVLVLKAVADQSCVDVLRILLRGPATQKHLLEVLGLNSGTLSRRMAELETLGLVDRDRRRGPYRLAFGEQTRALIQAAADLGRFGARKRADEADEYALGLRKEGFSGGHLVDRGRDLA